MSDPRNTQRRHEWMPNRMFDPETNPFAIQNLLKKEKKEDDAFLLNRDERPVFGYSDDALLKESTTQATVDFQFDELLDQPLSSASTIQSESNETASQESVSFILPAKVDVIPSVSFESAEVNSQQHIKSIEQDAHLVEPVQAEASNLVTQASHADEIAAERAVHAPAADLVDDASMSESDDESVNHDLLGHEQINNQLNDQVADGDTDSRINQYIDTTHQLIDSTELLADEGSSLLDETKATHEVHSESEIVGPSIVSTSSGVDNQADAQLLEAAREEARVEAHAAGFQEGLEAGLEQAKVEMQAKLDEKLGVIDKMIKSLQQLERDPNTLFEPMKKLAMHLAEQLVRGELTQSAQVIARLVDNCLRELAASGEKAVIVHLNPDDLEQYKPLITQFGDSMVLRPDALLSRGSVRASLDGSVVEDLIDRRTKGLSKSLAQPVASSWRPAMATPSAKPNVAPKPVIPAPIAVTLDSDDSEHIESDESDYDDDVMVDELSDNHTGDTQADRNDETHS